MSLYTTDPQHIESFTSKHPTVKSGNASLNFTLTDELPVEDLGEVVHREIQRRGGSASA